MSLTKIFPVVIIALAGFCVSAQAGIISVLDFTSANGSVGTALDNTTVGQTVFTTNVGGLTGLTLTAQGTANAGSAFLDSSSVGLGVNSSASNSLDDADGVDLSSGESIAFTFSQDVSILAVDFENIDNGATPTDIVSFGSTSLPGSSLTGTDTFTFAPPLFFTAGTAINFSEIAGDGVTLRSLTVEVSAVPEPGALAILGMGSVLVMVRRRRRK